MKRRLFEESLRRENPQGHSSGTIVRRIQTPNQNDVLIGRGKVVYVHIGNLWLRKLVTDRLSEYEAAYYAEKQHVSDDVVRTIHKHGGLFLKEDETWWIEVDEETARNKVSDLILVLGPSILSLDLSRS